MRQTLAHAGLESAGDVEGMMESMRGILQQAGAGYGRYGS